MHVPMCGARFPRVQSTSDGQRLPLRAGHCRGDVWITDDLVASRVQGRQFEQVLGDFRQRKQSHRPLRANRNGGTGQDQAFQDSRARQGGRRIAPSIENEKGIRRIRTGEERRFCNGNARRRARGRDDRPRRGRRRDRDEGRRSEAGHRTANRRARRAARQARRQRRQQRGKRQLRDARRFATLVPLWNPRLFRGCALEPRTSIRRWTPTRGYRSRRGSVLRASSIRRRTHATRLPATARPSGGPPASRPNARIVFVAPPRTSADLSAKELYDFGQNLSSRRHRNPAQISSAIGCTSYPRESPAPARERRDGQA